MKDMRHKSSSRSRRADVDTGGVIKVQFPAANKVGISFRDSKAYHRCWNCKHQKRERIGKLTTLQSELSCSTMPPVTSHLFSQRFLFKKTGDGSRDSQLKFLCHHVCGWVNRTSTTMGRPWGTLLMPEVRQHAVAAGPRIIMRGPKIIGEWI